MNINGDFFSGTDILAIEDPGLPLNMTVSPLSFNTGCSYSFCRTVQWTPIPGQENQTWQAHFVATSQCCANGECLPPTSSNIISVFLPVSRPVSVWSKSTVIQAKAWTLTVGESRAINLQCSTFQGVPVISIVSMSLNGAATSSSMGLNVALFQSTASAVTCPAGSPANPLKCTTTAVAMVTASAGDEGSTKQWCFSCGDAAGVESADQLQCITVSTNLCQYQVQHGDTLRAVSRRFYRDSGWVRLWNANPSLMDPDLGRVPRGSAGPMSGTELLQPGAILQLGPVYRVKYGDTLTSIAGMFETSIKALLESNPHIEAEEQLEYGTDLCVLACSAAADPAATLPGA